MPIWVKCGCGQELLLKDASAGETIRCPDCARDVIVPTIDASGGISTGIPPKASTSSPAIDPSGVPSQPLEGRLEALERENGQLRRRLAQTTWLSLAGPVALALAAYSALRPPGLAQPTTPASDVHPTGSHVVTADVVKAKSLLVEDQAGRVRARLGCDEGIPALVLTDSQGRDRAYYQIESGDDPVLAFARPDGSAHVILAAREQDAGLTLHRGPDVTGLSLTMSEELGSSLALYDEAGRFRSSYVVRPDGWARLDLYGESTNAGVNIGVSGDGRSTLGLFSALGGPEESPRFRGPRFLVMVDGNDALSITAASKVAARMLAEGKFEGLRGSALMHLGADGELNYTITDREGQIEGR